jgi:hypothetical protein
MLKAKHWEYCWKHCWKMLNHLNQAVSLFIYGCLDFVSISLSLSFVKWHRWNTRVWRKKSTVHRVQENWINTVEKCWLIWIKLYHFSFMVVLILSFFPFFFCFFHLFYLLHFIHVKWHRWNTRGSSAHFGKKEIVLQFQVLPFVVLIFFLWN